MKILLTLSVLLTLPALATAQGRWTLDVETTSVGTVTTRGVEGAGTYLYMVFKVSNKSGQDVPLRLSISVDTDVTGRSYRGSIDPVVKKAVEGRLGRKAGSLKSMNEARGDLADGESVEVIATFGRVDPQVDKFIFHVQGLKDRVYNDQYKTWVEDVALSLTYLRPGDEFYRQNDLLRFQRRRWTTEKEREELRRKS